MAPPFTLRPATPPDAPALAHVHTASWRETYTGLLPQEFLAGMTDDAARERRQRMWEVLAADPSQIVLVTQQDGEVVAFASGGPARDHPGVDAELYTLYALKSAHGQGLGRALLHALARELHLGGANSLALWVLDQNPTRQWYARQGAREAGEKTQPLPAGGELREVRMVWDNLAQLR
ncbi:GNAT family N-acetyltransferase [Deinococcus metallilatus]|uniref:GNAT family N-acetyltransferase n=1 Tax=Deinococcus metallilatus TaxID=1211322 RepID=A0AAJ5F4B7_9DEIO|nr:GNAT family N-acetyltransferase [Deinococcus metallilatus]MBB5294563.1 GNAT superfamily N-acetyltransferase [Deinococcus metallilatus]QBY07606.1 GNAT family N-acetyltransferase [Deinococcus metallilatus]RXJ14022.1 GNAT family N-acetyltransferase [Deinococcus metallilatus]TLK29987.1 GNAT family N-acetyltransferase [Deinococcus metallilatus]GMA15776.1 N-acetyltransferase [Deinococcus metallilatus]